MRHSRAFARIWRILGGASGDLREARWITYCLAKEAWVADRQAYYRRLGGPTPGDLL